MNASSEDEARLERLVTQALHELTPAPASLESRVLAEIERRAQLPWWHRRFAAWPAWVRLVFAAACTACAFFSLGAMRSLTGAVETTLGAPRSAPVLEHAQHLGLLLATLVRAAQALISALSGEWLYLGVALAALCYAAVFATAALAYRVLTERNTRLHPAPSR